MTVIYYAYLPDFLCWIFSLFLMSAIENTDNNFSTNKLKFTLNLLCKFPKIILLNKKSKSFNIYFHAYIYTLYLFAWAYLNMYKYIYLNKCIYYICSILFVFINTKLWQTSKITQSHTARWLQGLSFLCNPTCFDDLAKWLFQMSITPVFSQFHCND